MKLRDKYGWPVTTLMGFHPITNTMRRLIHTDIVQTWTRRNQSDATTSQRCVGVCVETNTENRNETARSAE